MVAKLQIGILFLCFLGCKEQTSQPLSLDPYERWRSYNLHDYTVDQIRSCYCPDGGKVVRIAVRSDTITSVRKLSDGSLVPYPRSRQYLTVDSLFGIIRNPGLDSINVTYDTTYGYPDMVDINPQQHPVDGGELYQTSNLQIP